MQVFVDKLALSATAEVVERKGLGHPDTICDALAERLSVKLSQYYLEHSGAILHHNVDKALIRAGRAQPAFGGGDMSEPLDVYFAGRATTEVGGRSVPIEEMAKDAAHEWFRENLHAIDPTVHVRVHCLIRPGSSDLRELYARGRAEAAVPLANDTSIGVGYAPLTDLERLVLELEEHLNSRAFIAQHGAHGEDVKLMAVRMGESARITVARAFVGRYLDSMRAYVDATEMLKQEILRFAGSRGLDLDVRINAADDASSGSVYLTVTGTSAEAGDDGEVGRGNRANGLITPLRPMSLEALAGKNPVTHVGKLYNVVARTIAESLVDSTSDIAAATCTLVSEIGRRIDDPRTVHVTLQTQRGSSPADFTGLVQDVVVAHLSSIGRLWEGIVAARVRLF